MRCILVHNDLLTTFVTVSMERYEIFMCVTGKNHELHPEIGVSLPKSTVETLKSNHVSPLKTRDFPFVHLPNSTNSDDFVVGKVIGGRFYFFELDFEMLKFIEKGGDYL